MTMCPNVRSLRSWDSWGFFYQRQGDREGDDHIVRHIDAEGNISWRHQFCALAVWIRGDDDVFDLGYSSGKPVRMMDPPRSRSTIH